MGGPKPGKRGRGAAGKGLVFIAAQQEGSRLGRIRLRPIADASAESLEAAVHWAVEPGSTICSDGGRGYGGLPAAGYQHQVVRSEGEGGDNLLPRCHRVASLLKRWLLGTHQGAVRPRPLAYYLAEFTFRFNRRPSLSRGKLFHRLIQQAVQIDPHPYAKLVRPQSIGVG